MTNIMRVTVIALLFTASQTLCAAKPVKITPGDKGEESGVEFRNYIVECSNGKSQPLTSWDSGKKWCLGKDSKSDCAKKQIKAAKIACKIN
jgi:hypothetical protein